jgi:hypothetical protein
MTAKKRMRATLAAIREKLYQRRHASVITSKPAIHDHLKTGQRDLTPD